MNDEPAPINDITELADLTDLADLSEEQRGCLFALSQPPLMFFLTFIATLILLTAIHDLYRW
ncbi:hypothetical protein AB0K09_30335 [Streptomyces sp. NPDC049577]|uniref:hypothetical protein n=1 Tax=Streptomyces sp. NPDC049577 TaxID=3155153 RepID=UPI00344182F4